MPVRLLLALGAVLLLPGCFFGPRLVAGGPSDADEAAARVRATLPAVEAHYADNQTYAGATVESLRDTYDAAIPDVELLVDDDAYCVEASVGSETRSYRSAAGSVAPGPCTATDLDTPQAPTAVETPPEYTDAELAVLAVIPSIEVYYAEKGTYAGLDRRKRLQDASLRDVHILVRKNGHAYCVEAPAEAPSAHYAGAGGPLAPGPC